MYKILKFAKKIKVLIYSLIFIFALFTLLRISTRFHLDGLSKWTIPVAFLIKIGAGLLLFYLHYNTYGIDELSHDGETFMKEGKYLNNVFYTSPLHYLQLLTGFGESTQLIEQHLYMTEYWSAGDLTLINDSKNIIRIHSLIHFFSANTYLVHLSILCFLSLIGIKLIYQSIQPYTSQSKILVFSVLLLVPSTIFWTSSMMKEPMLLLGMGIMLYSLIKVQNKTGKVIYFLLSCCILIAFKPYVLACFLLALIAVLVYKYVFHHRLIFTLISLFTGALLLGFLAKKPTQKIVDNLTRKQFDFVNVGKGGLHVIADSCIYYFQPHQYDKIEFKGNKVRLTQDVDAFIIHFGSTQKPKPIHLKPQKSEWWTVTYFAQGCSSYIETTPISNSFSQLIKNIPEALTNSIFRPFFNDPGSKLKYLSFLEIWMIVFFLIIAIVNRRKLSKREKELIFGLLIFAFLLFILIGWTTPVIGAITRYRFPAQLAIIIIGIILIKPISSIRWKKNMS